jgi:hypothetical protein
MVDELDKTNYMRKIRYTWYDGDEEESYVVYQDEDLLNKDLSELFNKYKRSRDPETHTPDMYRNILEGLRVKGYCVVDWYDEDVVYFVDDSDDYLSQRVTKKVFEPLILDSEVEEATSKLECGK